MFDLVKPKSEEVHIHKYQRFEIGKNRHMIFKCMVPGCSHFLSNKELVVGKISRCWGGTIDRDCDNRVTLDSSFTMPKASGRKPYCDDCKELAKQRRELRKKWSLLQNRA